MESKPCQANDNGKTCEKDARAKCFHCSYDLCLMHLTEHTQSIENQTRTFLYSHEKILNDLYKKFETLTISSRILEYPFLQLEKWRKDAHQKLDQLAEQKRQEIEKILFDYEILFTTKITEQKQKIDILKTQLNNLSQQTNITNKDIKYIENKINEIKIFLQSIDKHSIKIISYDFFLNIRTNFFDSKIIQQTTSSNINQIRNTRPEIKEKNKQYFNKKRSLSVSLL